MVGFECLEAYTKSHYRSQIAHNSCVEADSPPYILR